ncbi:hypothetical protein [Candidatus Accumulibacter sp. ACC003]|uniref:hypothetical protein n=1 Tax=Candidatus Accumulibacter sp. ACC003 TaxID=2823334 RepID=UPI0025C23EDE|nr:hypothetical protein [Candidatus Accumulibacter sp. ACC003]
MLKSDSVVQWGSLHIREEYRMQTRNRVAMSPIANAAPPPQAKSGLSAFHMALYTPAAALLLAIA